MVPFILRIHLGASIFLAALTLGNVALAMLFPPVLEWEIRGGKGYLQMG